ncbi:phage tail protein I [Agrobacterium genomosp. 3]|uniref:phage tail protein I n=1 Tax=Rhizobium/Agrobacterium group TaxID=227290 RepID=UPI001CD8462A|nr:phage tail protein I [Rhizobium sp. SSA_523]MCA1868913.1 phage tail protein I [Agrobacterium tomkonis]MCA1879326.1 phage tail protein I [Agrobacterium tumefaciens]MCA1894489.1 phage tail protein I [Agrobacterium tomkonis]MCO5734130.1 phage tail protein I [Rhizobium sp. SSA_523]WKC24767.1 phage tail protein I [Rhizobium sp. SSA_523]
MADVVPLLTSSTGPFERAVAAGMSDGLPVPYAVLLDPYRCPAEMLPWLAAQYSVDLWFDEWPEARKREVIAQHAGVSVLYDGELAALKTTRAAAARYLELVDATIIHKRSHPARFPVGRIVLGKSPINHPPFVARFLVKTTLVQPRGSFCVGRSALGKAALRPRDRRPLERAEKALVVSKAPHTQYSVSFAHRRPITLDDGYDIDAGYVLGSYMDRTSL